MLHVGAPVRIGALNESQPLRQRKNFVNLTSGPWGLSAFLSGSGTAAGSSSMTSPAADRGNHGSNGANAPVLPASASRALYSIREAELGSSYDEAPRCRRGNRRLRCRSPPLPGHSFVRLQRSPFSCPGHAPPSWREHGGRLRRNGAGRSTSPAGVLPANLEKRAWHPIKQRDRA